MSATSNNSNLDYECSFGLKRETNSTIAGDRVLSHCSDPWVSHTDVRILIREVEMMAVLFLLWIEKFTGSSSNLTKI